MPAEVTSLLHSQKRETISQIPQKEGDVKRLPKVKFMPLEPCANMARQLRAAISSLGSKDSSWDVAVECCSSKGSPTNSLLSSPEDLTSLAGESEDFEVDYCGLSTATSLYFGEDGDMLSPQTHSSTIVGDVLDDEAAQAIGGLSLISHRSDVSCASTMSDGTWVDNVAQPSNASCSLEEACVKGAMESLVAERTGSGRVPCSIPFENLVFKRIVGRGQYGHVRIVEDSRSNAMYALKVVPKALIAGRKQEEQVINECRAMMLVDSRFCIRLEGAYQNRDALFFLMEWVGGGELLSHLDLAGAFPEAIARFYVASLLLALDHVHSLGLVYRDIKPENLLLDRRGYLKMVDFGFAKDISSERTFTICGTPEYQAPEVILGAGTGREADYWAVGVLAYELLVGSTPFVSTSRDPMEVFRRVVAGKYRVPSRMCPQAADLIKLLLQVDPKERLGSGSGGVSDIMEHPWFADFDWEALKAGTLKAPVIPNMASARDTRNYDVFREPGIPPYEGETANPVWDTMWEWTDVSV